MSSEVEISREKRSGVEISKEKCSGIGISGEQRAGLALIYGARYAVGRLPRTLV